MKGLCYVYVDELDAKSLTKYIVEILTKYGIPLQNCVSQGYDGASVPACTGVQTRMKAHCPKATYIHCCAHRLNLVLVDSTRSIKISAEFFKLLVCFHVPSNSTQVFFRSSGKAIRLIGTRWACKHDAVESV